MGYMHIQLLLIILISKILVLTKWGFLPALMGNLSFEVEEAEEAHSLLTYEDVFKFDYALIILTSYC